MAQVNYNGPGNSVRRLSVSRSNDGALWSSLVLLNPFLLSFLFDFAMPLRKKRNFKNLTLGNSPVVVSQPETVPDKRRSSVRRLEEEYDRLCEKIKDLEPGLELRLDLRPDDFENVDELGRGNGGTVCKVLHVRTNTVMAKKVKR